MPTWTEPSAFGAVASFTGDMPPVTSARLAGELHEHRVDGRLAGRRRRAGGSSSRSCRRCRGSRPGSAAFASALIPSGRTSSPRAAARPSASWTARHCTRHRSDSDDARPRDAASAPTSFPMAREDITARADACAPARAHARAADVRVDLRRRDVGVAEHRLHRAQVGAALDEVGRERVAQLVRRDVAAREPHAGASRVAAQQLPEPLARHRPAALGQEQRALGRIAHERRAIVGDVAARLRRAPRRRRARAASCCPCR